MTRRIIIMQRLILALVLTSIAGLGLVLTSLPAVSEHPSQSSSPVLPPVRAEGVGP